MHRQGIDVRHSNGNYYTHSGSWKDQPFILDVNSDSHNHAWFEYHREVPELLMYGPVADEDFIAVQNGGGPMQLVQDRLHRWRDGEKACGSEASLHNHRCTQANPVHTGYPQANPGPEIGASEGS